MTELRDVSVLLGNSKHILNISSFQENETEHYRVANNSKKHHLGSTMPDLSFDSAMHKVNIYGVPLIVVVGIITNILAYAVFTKSYLRKVALIPYLAGIAVSDSGFLFTFFLSFLTYNHELPLLNQVGLCQFGTFANFVFLFLSKWYLVAMMVEKFISVFWPSKKSSMCTSFRAKAVLISLAVLAIVCYSYMIYFFGPQTNKFTGHRYCNPWQEFHKHFSNLMFVDAFIVSVVPLLVTLVLLSLIIIHGCTCCRESYAFDNVCRRHDKSKQAKETMFISKLLFPLVALDFVCQLPLSVLRIIGLFNRVGQKDLIPKVQLVV